ncbi:MAG: hypothetical protein IJ612_02385, partial [Prevotella sp.]|nr:hypothetical protein [Prevotella sp.]
LDLDEEDMRLLTFFCHRLINHDDDDIRFSQMEDIFDGAAEYNAAKAKLRSAKHTLMKKKLIEHLCLRAALPLQGAVREAFCRGTGLHLARNDS